MTSPISTYLWPGQSHFGFGAAGLVGQHAGTWQATRAFIVTDPGIIAAALLTTVISSLDTAGVSYIIYDEAPPNPDVASVDAAGAAYRESGAGLVIGVGGGSVLDAAKAVRLLAGGPAAASIAEYLLILGDDARPAPHPHSLPPMIAIPTTAGTGSEATPWAVITDHTRRLKAAVGGPYLIPNVALVDPELTLTLPARLTAATGLDALSHCIEAYVSTKDNPLLDPMILYGVELIGNNLRAAVAGGSSRDKAALDARHHMALASLIGGIAISSKWLGACHSLAHQLSTFANVHHGVACALMLPPQMAYSLASALPRYARIGAALDPSQPAQGPLRQRAAQTVVSVRELIQAVGLPTRLRDVGVAEAIIPDMAKHACLDLNWSTNPRAVSEAAMEQLYRQAF